MEESVGEPRCSPVLAVVKWRRLFPWKLGVKNGGSSAGARRPSAAAEPMAGITTKHTKHTKAGGAFRRGRGRPRPQPSRIRGLTRSREAREKKGGGWATEGTEGHGNDAGAHAGARRRRETSGLVGAESCSARDDAGIPANARRTGCAAPAAGLRRSRVGRCVRRRVRAPRGVRPCPRAEQDSAPTGGPDRTPGRGWPARQQAEDRGSLAGAKKGAQVFAKNTDAARTTA